MRSATACHKIKSNIRHNTDLESFLMNKDREGGCGGGGGESFLMNKDRQEAGGGGRGHKSKSKIRLRFHTIQPHFQLCDPP